MPLFPDSLLSLYSLINRTGLLQKPFFQHLFARSYYGYKRWIEDPFAPLIKARPDLFTGGNILDVGANIGYTAVLFSTALSTRYRVFAFEPEAKNYQLLKWSLSDRGLRGRIIPVQAAVGNTDGFVDLWLNTGHPADHRVVTELFHGVPGSSTETQRVPILRLDDFCANELSGQPIGFIKMDVQGYEEQVCEGMTTTLQLNPNALVAVEYFPQGIAQLGFNPQNLLLFFEKRGYGMYTLERHGRLAKADYSSASQLVQARGYVDLLFSKSDKILDDKP